MKLFVFSFLTLLLSAAHCLAAEYGDGSIISSDTVWEGDVHITGVVFIPEGVTLTVKPGTVVSFQRSEKTYAEPGEDEVLIPGSGIRAEGRIIANGARDNMISFTSAAPGPKSPGDWGCIFLDHSKGSVFRYCRFEHSAYTLHAHFSQFDVSRCIITNNEDGSRLGTCRASFDHCDITENTGKGLNFRQCRNTVTYCNITGNQDGVFLNEKDQACVISDNNIYGNRGMDLRLGEFHKEDVRLSGNWWGSAGPGEIARHVYDHADDPQVGRAIIEPAQSKIAGAGMDGLTVKALWKFKTGGFVDSSPAVSDGIVFFGSWDKNFYALRADSGALIWKFITGDCVDSSPEVSGGKVIFGSWDRNVYALDAKTGKLVWKFLMPPSNFDDHRQASPAVSDKQVYMGGFNGKVYAIDIDTGKKIAEFNTDGSIRSRLVYKSWTIYGLGAIGHALLMAGSADGSLHAWDIRTGQQEWRFKTGGAVFSSPSVVFERIIEEPGCYDCPTGEVPSKIYFGSRDGNVYCTQADKKIWSYDTGSRIEYSSPLIVSGSLPSSLGGRGQGEGAGGLVLIGDCNGVLHAVDKDTGRPAWTFKGEGGIYSSPQLSGRKVVYGDNAGMVYWLDPGTGRMAGSFRAGDAVQGLSAGPGGVVYAGSRDGCLYAIGAGE